MLPGYLFLLAFAVVIVINLWGFWKALSISFVNNAPLGMIMAFVFWPLGLMIGIAATPPAPERRPYEWLDRPPHTDPTY